MTPYIIILIFIAAAALSDIFLRRYNHIFLIGIVVVCSIFVGGRGDCDKDYENYAGYYKNIPPLKDFSFEITEEFPVEPGFLFICSTLKALNLPMQSIFLLMAFVTFIVMGYVFYKFSSYPILSFLIYWGSFFLFFFIQIRMAFVSAMLLWTLSLLGEKKILQCLVVIFFSSFIQSAAIIGFLFIPFFYIPLNRPIIIAWLIVIFFLFYIDFGNIIEKISIQIDEKRFETYQDIENTNLQSFYIYLLLFLPVLYFWENLDLEENYFYRPVVAGCIFSLVIFPIFLKYSILCRFSTIFWPLFPILFSSYFSSLKENTFNQICGYLLIVTYSFLKFMPHLKYVEPYKNVLFN